MRHHAAARLGVAAAAALALALSFTSCAPDQQASGGESDTLVLGVVGNSKDEVQPYTTNYSSSGAAIRFNVYDSLTRYDTDGTVQLALAESLTPNETLDVWTVKLRPDLKTHDGGDFNADDLVESVSYIVDPENQYPAATQIDYITEDGIEKIDDLTVEFHLTRPVGTFAEAWANPYLVLRGLDDEGNSVGTGPFKIESFTAGQEARLVRFDDYWGEKPGFTNLTMAFMTDQDAITNALRAGQIDVSYSVPFTDVESLSSADGIEILTSESAAYPIMTMRVDIEPFNDPRVQEALRLVVDREEIAENAYGGFATIANDYLGNNSACGDPDVPQREQDIDRAKELLQEAGQENLEFELVTDAAFPGMMEMAQLYSQQAAEAGVTITVRKLDVASFLNQWLEWPFLISRSSSPYEISARTHFMPGGDENASHFDNPEFTALFEQMQATADTDRQCELITQMREIEWREGSGNIVPTYPQTITAYRDTVKGLQPDLFGRTSINYAGVTLEK
ncbi:MAG: ABC transporter substrate-binding protein [Leucobacter sp.]